MASFLLPLVHVLKGDPAEAVRSLRELHLAPGSQGTPPAYTAPWVAAAYAALGHAEDAFRVLEKSIEERRFSILMLNVEGTIFDVLRSDPRFPRLTRKLGLDHPFSSVK
jgi:hypothetical protein